MIFEFSNPFAHVMRPYSSFPHSHTLQTDFMRKVEDTVKVFIDLYDFVTLGLFGFVEDLKDLCAVEPEARYALHLMWPLPSILQEYKNSYIFTNEPPTFGEFYWIRDPSSFDKKKKLYYVDAHGIAEIVKINGIVMFSKTIKELNQDEAKKIYLSNEQLNRLITLNGGHTRPEKAVEPKKNKIQHITAQLKKLAAHVFYPPLRAIDFLGNIILRATFAVTLTIAMLPVVAIAHAISQVVAWFKHRTAESIMVEKEEWVTSDQSLGKFHGSTKEIIKQTLGQILPRPEELRKLYLEEVIEVTAINEALHTATVTISGTSERIGIYQGANTRYRCPIQKKDIPLPEQESALPLFKLKLQVDSNNYIYALFNKRNDPRLKALCELNPYVADQLDWKKFFKNG